MALIKCSECGHEIAKSAKTCPSCGAKNRARTGCLAQGAAVLVAMFVIGIIAQQCSDYQQNQASEDARQVEARAAAERQRKEAERKRAEQARLAAMTPAERAAEEKRLAAEAAARAKAVSEAKEKLRLAELRRQGLAWNYSTYLDDLTKKYIESAEVSSTNKVSFDFPYGGEQRATLELRKHPRYGLDVILSVERGQFLCGIDDCRVAVVFDDAPVQYFSAGEPADHSTTYLFIRNESLFIKRLRTAEKVRISASFYQAGAPTFEFNVGHLNWK